MGGYGGQNQIQHQAGHLMIINRIQRRSIPPRALTESMTSIAQGVVVQAASTSEYTVDDTQTPTGDAGTLSALLNWIGHMVKAITGKANWRTAPARTLEQCVDTAGLTTDTIPVATGANTIGSSRISLNATNDDVFSAVLIPYLPGDESTSLGYTVAVGDSLDTDNDCTALHGASYSGEGVSGLSTNGNAVQGQVSGSGHAGYFLQTGTGKGMQAVISNTSNTNHAVEAATDGSGNAVKGVSTGASVVGFFESQSASPSGAVVHASATASGHDEPLYKGGTAGTGNLLQLQKGGTDKFVVDNSGSLVGLRVVQAEKTSNYTITDSDMTLLVDTTSGSVTLTLPNPSGKAGRVWIILDHKDKFSTNKLVIDPDTYELNGLTADRDITLSGAWIMITTDGTRYRMLVNYPRKNGEICLLESKAGIDGKTIANHNLNPVMDSGRKSVVTHMVVRTTAATAVTVAAQCSLGVVIGSYTDIVGTTTLTGLTAIDKVTVVDSKAAASVVGGGGNIVFRISTGATATTLTLTVDVFGYYLD